MRLRGISASRNPPLIPPRVTRLLFCLLTAWAVLGAAPPAHAQDSRPQDPYAGTWACEVRQNTDCDKCPGYPGRPQGLRVAVKAHDDGTHEVCMLLGGGRDCRRVRISDKGKAGYTDKGGTARSGWTSKVHYSFDGDSLVGTEQGSIRGACSCTYFSRFDCVRETDQGPSAGQ